MKIKTMALCGLFAALTAICSWLAVPIGDIAVTLQTFAVFLGLFLLGGRGGSIAFLVYLCLGAVGAPVFSGFRGGIGAFLDPSGGYLWGLLLGCGIYWLLQKRPVHRLIVAALAMAVCYACGSLWYSFAYLADSNLWVIILKCVLPYLLPDALKIYLACTLSRRLKRIV